MAYKAVWLCLEARGKGEQADFEDSVEGLLSILPSNKRKEVETEAKDYTDEVLEPVFKTFAGVKLGSVENPVFTNLKEDLDYDPKFRQDKVVGKDDDGHDIIETTYGEPVLISPIMVPRMKTNYDKLFSKIIKKLEEANLFWRKSYTTEIWGKIPEDKLKKYPATPTLKKNDVPQFVDPPEGYEGTSKWMNWHGYYVRVDDDANPAVLNEFQRILDEIEALIIVITGAPGKGKTYAGLGLAEVLDPKFDVQKQVVFTTDEFLKLISEGSSLDMGQAILVDEAQFVAGARSWYEDLQKDLMNQLQSIRRMNLIIIIVALDKDILDNIARNFVITHELNMVKRGEGVLDAFNKVKWRKEPYRNEIGHLKQKLPGYLECKCIDSCLRCKASGMQKGLWEKREQWEELGLDSEICYNVRAQYERKKREFLGNAAVDSREKNAEKNEKKIKHTYASRKKLLLEDGGKILRVDENGNLIMATVARVCDPSGESSGVSDSTLYSTANRLRREEPDFIARLPRENRK